MLKIVDNSDIELKDYAEQCLKDQKELYGKRYCPCALERNTDWICPCKEFRQTISVGECHCGRYMKVNDELI